MPTVDTSQNASAPTAQRATGAPWLPGAQPTAVDALAEWFEEVYRGAEADVGRVPWAHGGPKPTPNLSLLAWLNAAAAGRVRPGGCVAVVGCGLGQDAAELCSRGYDVRAFDVSAEAIAWAKRLWPAHADSFIQADLLSLPPRMLRRFDLVVEVHTLQAVPPALRGEMASAMASLLRPHGLLLAIAHGRPASTPIESVEGPPFPLTAEELKAAFAAAGLTPDGPTDAFEDDTDPPRLRLRGVFRRSLA